jgi:hypothetical protein
MQSQTYKYKVQKASKGRMQYGHVNRNSPFLLPFSAHDSPTLKRSIEAHGAVAGDYKPNDLSYTLAN